MAALLVEGGARHEKRLKRPREIEGHGLAKARANGVLVREPEFVVVVPDRIYPNIEHVLPQCSPPPRGAGAAREVDMSAFAIPELRNGGFAALSGDKGAGRFG